MRKRQTNAVIGFPLGHSLGSIWHAEVYQMLGVDAEYIKDEGEDIAELVERVRNKPYGLTAVTIPHKETIISLLDVVDDDAKEIGAVNTVINRDGILTGYNTDIYGVKYALREVDLAGKNVMVLGAGGAARAVMYVLKKGGANIMCVNRTRGRAEKLIGEFGGKVLDFDEVEPDEIDLIINTTPIGMSPNTNVSPLPKDFLRSYHIVFDIVYNPVDTKLLQDAKEIGAKTIFGLDMYIAQGLRQVELWLGGELDLDFEEIKGWLIKQI